MKYYSPTFFSAIIEWDYKQSVSKSDAVMFSNELEKIWKDCERVIA